MHDLKRMDQEQPQPIQCEAKISVMEEHILVIVVRDISERFRRFEAEKRVISETTARRKDVAANRFTRHEVKNGLLAAIGLCDSMKEVTEGDAQMILKRIESNSSNSDVQDLCTTISNDRREPSTRTHCIVELGNTLTGILDTVLTEAMVRDVIHEVYEPKIENVNLSNVLATTMSASKNRNQKRRFPIVTNPDPLPGFSTDPHLWKYVHRNAISNACKYGKLSGEVTTEILWDEVMQVLTVNVINLPGNNHAEMSAMGAKSNSTIFSLRKKLKVQIDGSGSSADQSVGNGTWLMTKCAATLGGQCSIKVSFWCISPVFSICHYFSL
jgi:signal transduction histidine kinase